MVSGIRLVLTVDGIELLLLLDYEVLPKEVYETVVTGKRILHRRSEQ